jgi:hypothetical protein
MVHWGIKYHLRIKASWFVPEKINHAPRRKFLLSGGEGEKN